MTNGGMKHLEIAQKGKEEVQRGIAKIQGTAVPVDVTGTDGMNTPSQKYPTDGHRDDEKVGSAAQPHPEGLAYEQGGVGDQASPPYQPLSQGSSGHGYGTDTKPGYEAQTDSNTTPVGEHSSGEAVPGGPGGFRRRNVDSQGPGGQGQTDGGSGYQQEYESFVGRK